MRRKQVICLIVRPGTESSCRIQDYGVVGDCRAAALVSKHGSIDWLCWPRFDSPAIFAALLDHERGGHWSICPLPPYRSERAYIPESNVLQTTFVCTTGRVTLTDLMPVANDEFRRNNVVPDHEVVRHVVCTEGEIAVQIDFQPRASYGLRPVSIQKRKALGLCMSVGRGEYYLRSNVDLSEKADRAESLVRMKRGDALEFSLSYAEESPTVLPALGPETERKIERSVRWWQEWASQCTYKGPYRDEVLRSALALKLLTYAPSGAIAAAATTSLPERLGGDLNWDYRYCWLRDASLTVRAMLGLGYHAEAETFLNWLLHATRLTQPELRVFYTVFGESPARERELQYLDGFCSSRPVRIGNAARNQLQLDVYGEVIDAAAQYARYAQALDRTTRKVLLGLGRYVAQNWDQPDEGIWEPRSGRQHNTHSRLLCWTALDRLLALHEKGLLKGAPQDLFIRERERIREQILSRGWNEGAQSYASVLDSDSVDATLLRIPWYGFEKADGKRMKTTYLRVRKELGAGGGLLYRYNSQPSEGAFGICGFWEAEYLAIGGGTLQQAHACFRQLLSYRNDLGLYGEEIDPQTGEALGNFPQAFTHVGLISTALSIAEREQGKRHPAQHTGHNVAFSEIRAA